MLSENDLIGYHWEITTQDKLIDYGFGFLGNSRDRDEWKSSIEKGCDIYIPDFDCEIECKFVNVPVWLSSIDHNYIPRFNGSTYKIVVTNDLTKFSSKDKEALKRAGIKLVNLQYLIPLLSSIADKMNRLILSVYSYCELHEDYHALFEVYKFLKSKREKYEGLGLVKYPTKEQLSKYFEGAING
jgi:hypothetical protein